MAHDSLRDTLSQMSLIQGTTTRPYCLPRSVTAPEFLALPYMEAALKELSRAGYAVYPEDVARLSPLGRRHLNVHGRHAFVLPEAVAQGQLRPLRNTRQNP